MEQELWQLLGLYLLVINLWGFLLMWADKRKAGRRDWRLPEKLLFLPAVLGGAAGCVLGMQMLRHKTRKPLFSRGMPLLLGLQTILLCWLVLWLR